MSRMTLPENAGSSRPRPGGLPIHVLVLLATLGVWWLLPGYHQHLTSGPLAEGAPPRLALALAVSTVLAALWGLCIRQLTRPLFAGSGERRSVAAAVTIGVVLYMVLAVQDLWMTHVARQPAETIATMDPDVLTTEVPDEPRLRARIAGFYDAMGGRDAATMYAMSQMPAERSPRSLSDFRRQWSLDSDWSSAPRSTWRVESLETCFCTGWTWRDGSRSLRCVLLLGASATEPGGSTPQHTFLDTWEHAAGEWYHRCPGPAVPQCPADPYAEGYCRASYVLSGCSGPGATEGRCQKRPDIEAGRSRTARRT